MRRLPCSGRSGVPCQHHPPPRDPRPGVLQALETKVAYVIDTLGARLVPFSSEQEGATRWPAGGEAPHSRGGVC